MHGKRVPILEEAANRSKGVRLPNRPKVAGFKNYAGTAGVPPAGGQGGFTLRAPTVIRQGRVPQTPTMRSLLFVVAVLVLASGCAAPPNVKEQAPELSVGSSTLVGVAGEGGTIVGQVFDDELRPVPRALVGLQHLAAEAVTADDGSFRFDGVPPGPQVIVAQALGYESQAKRIEVVDDETVQVAFSLKGILLETQPRILSYVRVSLIALDGAFVSTTLDPIYNVSAMCGQCHHNARFDVQPLQVHVQPTWQPQATNSVVYSSVRIRFNWEPDNSTSTLHQKVGQAVLFDEAAMKSLNGERRSEFNLTVGAGLYSIFIQQRVDTWLTFAYVNKLPEDYSALPDG